MNEITVTFTEDEARAMVPSPTKLDIEGWNRKVDLMEDAVAKIRVALREQGTPQQPKEQATLDGLTA